MAGERWDRIRRLFEAALERSPAERAAYLDGIGEIEPEFREEVAALLASHRSDTASEGQGVAPGATVLKPDAVRSFEEKLTPSRVGPYRNLREIGEGGMGIVFEALQETPVRRTVALKLIKWGMDTREVIARFESERQALALMNHPNIASVYDAGSTEEGRPYFAMEFVAGIPVTEYCDRGRLSIRARLDIFVQVCDGVQHAHQKGIIHRDIKPTNVLVVVVDGKPVPKLIDFGVAKATSHRLTERTLETVQGQLVGTPEYMSPEQAELTNVDVDTRTDVYSLGVLLYELLVGAQPFAAADRGGFAEIQRRLREDEPPLPSTRVGGLGEKSTVSAVNRRLEVQTLARQLRGDLDWITMKALEKDRARRYPSPSELAADIGRYLRFEPVLASPPSRAYRFSKFVRRHRVGVAALALVLLALSLGIVGTTLGLIEARNRQREALGEAAKATAVHDFLRDTLGSADPFEGSGRDVTVVEMLDDAAARIDHAFEGEPAIEAAVRNTVGLTYLNLGRHQDAEPLLRSAFELRRRPGGDSLDLAESLNAIARLNHAAGDYPEARAAAEEGLSMRRRLLGDRHPAVAESLHYLSEIVKDSGDYSRAEALARESLSIRREAFNAGPQLRVAESLLGLSAALASQGELAEAETTHRESLDILTQIFGRDHLQAAVSLSSLGQLLNSKGDNRGAESALREALPILRRELPAAHEEVALALTHLATVLQDKGEYREAEELFREALSIRRQLFGEEHPRIAESVNNLGVLFLNKDDLDAAQPFLLEALAMNRSLYGEEHPNISDNLNNLAIVYRGKGDYRAAEEMFLAVLELDRKQLGEGHPYVHATINNLAGLYSRMGDLARAESEHRRALALQESALPEGHWQIANTRSLLAAVLTKAKRFAEAETLLVESYPILSAHFGETHERTKAARERLDALYAAWRKGK